jgi:hypothetical protein
VTGHGGHVVLANVLLDHPASRESLARLANGVLHVAHPLDRHALGVALVVEGHDLLLQQLVQVLRVVLVHALVVRFRNGPAVAAGPALRPPPIERPDLRDPVQCRLHAARSTGLHRHPRNVEPQVDTLDQTVGEVHLVVFQERDTPFERGVACEAVHALQQVLGGLIGRVGLPREDHLDWSVRLREDPPQSLGIPEQEVCPLVGREAACEPDCERMWVE